MHLANTIIILATRCMFAKELAVNDFYWNSYPNQVDIIISPSTPVQRIIVCGRKLVVKYESRMGQMAKL